MSDTRHPTLAPIYDEKIALLEGEIKRLQNELEVSEACNRAKTVAIANIRTALKELSGLKD